MFEIILQTYVGFAKMLAPKYEFKRWQENLLGILGTLVILMILDFLGAGLVLFLEEQDSGRSDFRTIAIILTTIGAFLLVFQIVIIIIVLLHQHGEEKQNKLD